MAFQPSEQGVWISALNDSFCITAVGYLQLTVGPSRSLFGDKTQKWSLEGFDPMVAAKT
jgi:hypothetical protein